MYSHFHRHKKKNSTTIKPPFPGTCGQGHPGLRIWYKECLRASPISRTLTAIRCVVQPAARVANGWWMCEAEAGHGAPLAANSTTKCFRLYANHDFLMCVSSLLSLWPLLVMSNSLSVYIILSLYTHKHRHFTTTFVLPMRPPPGIAIHRTTEAAR